MCIGKQWEGIPLFGVRKHFIKTCRRLAEKKVIPRHKAARNRKQARKRFRRLCDPTHEGFPEREGGIIGGWLGRGGGFDVEFPPVVISSQSSVVCHQWHLGDFTCCRNGTG